MDKNWVTAGKNKTANQLKAQLQKIYSFDFLYHPQVSAIKTLFKYT